METRGSSRTRLLHMRAISEVNMTPIMDLTFILLITFIISFPLVEQGVDIELPSGKGAAIEAGKSLTLSVDAKGRYFVDMQPVSVEELAAELRVRKEATPDMTVIIRGDKAVAYEKIMVLISLSQEAGLNRIGLINHAAGGGG